VWDEAVAFVTIEHLSSFGDVGAAWNGFTLDTILTWTTTDGEVTITDCKTSASGELVIPDTIDGNPVTAIANSAFLDCSSLTSIIIPDSVTSIGSYAFWRCTSLMAINIPVDNPNYVSVDGILFNKNMTVLIQYPEGKSEEDYSIPDSVTTIGSSAFEGGPTRITIENSRPTQAAYDAAVATARTAGQGDVTSDPASYSLVTQASYEALEDALVAMTADRDSRPTRAAYDAVVADRDSRPTLAEVQDARVGSIVLAKDWQSGEVSLCFGLQKTEDFVTWEAFEGGTWSEAPNGEFKLTLPLGEAKKWLRLTMPE